MRAISFLFALLLLPVYSQGQLPDDLQSQAEAAITRGARHLLQTQNPDGTWGSYPHPAVSALCAMAIHNSPGIDAAERDAATDTAMTYVLTFRQKNGSIYPADRSDKESANYPNYTTSIVILAMATIGDPDHIPIMKEARRYLQASQFGDPDKVDFGGIGYGKTGRADLSNGAWAAEALYFTDYLDNEPYNTDPTASERTQKMWQDMQVFLTKVQNLPETNPQPYVSNHPDDRGGFIYRPSESKAGSRDGDDAVTSLVSSGSMTYAGLKSMIYSRLSRNDVRVKGALDYLKRHWTLQENPGMGLQGLYYYLLTMTKALDAYGQPAITDSEGVSHNWREEVARRFLELQQDDGSWVNSNGRYMESFAPLSTSYSVIGLKVLTRHASLKHPEN